ncbi:MAG: glycosyltransferase 87 family protein [Pirellulales bacterium]
MSRRSAIAVSCYVLMGFILRMTHGMFHPTMVWTLAGVLTCVGYLAFRPGAAAFVSERSSPAGTLAAVLFASAIMLAMNPLLITAKPGAALMTVAYSSFVLSIVAGMYCIGHFCSPRFPRGVAMTLLAACFVSLFVMRVGSVIAAPAPQIDVFVTNSLACEYFLDGKNPYAQTYPDIYEGAKGYEPGFFYWPAYLYVATPFYALGDIRFAVVAGDLLTAAFIVVLLRRAGLKGDAVWLAPLAWLACPVSLMVLELGWIDPLLVTIGAGLAASLASRRLVLSGVAIGLLAATKQYGALAGMVTLAWIWANERRQVPRALAAAAATFVVLVGPFVLADWRGFYESTVAVYINTAMRLDALSLLVWAKRVMQIDVGGGWLLGAYLAIVVVACWRLGQSLTSPRDWAGVVAFAYGAIFLLAKLAFCNYYYFVSFWMLLYACLSLVDDRHAQWLAPPRLGDGTERSAAASRAGEGAALWPA